MNRLLRYSFGLIMLMCAFRGWSQNSVTLSGYVKDAETGETLIGASVYLAETQTGATTNAYGYFALRLEPGIYTVKTAFIGYAAFSREMNLTEDATLQIELSPESVELNEVVLTGEGVNRRLKSTEVSKTVLSIQEVKNIPQLLGEVDIIRSIQTLPGVTSVGEGASGFNVRGGNIDQNLILLDEAPVYNSSHLFGFFSVFNGDAVKDVVLHKGGIPAVYGGRLSSVLDVHQKDGNKKKFAGTGGIGILSSRLTLEGPIQRDKSSWMIAGRRSYADLFLALGPEDLRGNQAFFYDLNAKVNFKINERNQLFASAYLGRDVFGFDSLFRFNWGNSTFSLRWNHLFNDRLFSNTTLVLSDYDYSLGIPSGFQSFDWVSGINNVHLKSDYTAYVNDKHTMKFGISALSYVFEPGIVEPLEELSFINTLNLANKQALESGIYWSDEWELNERLQVSIGLRYSYFARFGSDTIFEYEPGVPISEETLIDTVIYNAGEFFWSQGGWEPRFSARWLADENISIKTSYHRTLQYIHLVSNTTSATPIDIWTPSGPHIKPAEANQWTIGYFQNTPKGNYEWSAEVYYKAFTNLLDYKNGADLILNPTIETELASGTGYSKGLELLVRKNSGSLTGWLAYTWSQTRLKVEGLAPEESINFGNYYPSNWDKTHDFTAVMNQKINSFWTVSGQFAYQTGRPITYPDGKYTQDGIVIPVYSTRNDYRVPDYHRLDVSATYAFKKSGWAKGSLTFGVYNVYARRNPFSIFFRENPDMPGQTQAVQLSILGTAVPFVTYNFKF